jgi:hypothetical protein
MNALSLSLFSLSFSFSPSPSSRFSICGATRRIFYLYIITRIGPSSPPRLHSTNPPSSSSLPSRRVLFLSSHAPRFPRAPRFSCSRPCLRRCRCPPSALRPAGALARVAYALYLFYFIIKQTSSCHPRADTRLYTRPRPRRIHVKHSLHLTRGSAYRTDTKNIFPLRCPSSSCYPGIVLPSRVPEPCYPSSRGRPLIASLKGIPS